MISNHVSFLSLRMRTRGGQSALWRWVFLPRFPFWKILSSFFVIFLCPSYHFDLQTGTPKGAPIGAQVKKGAPGAQLWGTSSHTLCSCGFPRHFLPYFWYQPLLCHIFDINPYFVIFFLKTGPFCRRDTEPGTMEWLYRRLLHTKNNYCLHLNSLWVWLCNRLFTKWASLFIWKHVTFEPK